MSLYCPEMETGKPVSESCFSLVRSYNSPSADVITHSVVIGGQARIVLYSNSNKQVSSVGRDPM